MNGEEAELRAKEYLQQQGLELLLHNYRARVGEIDLVMRSGRTLVIVEVRSRSHQQWGGAFASVDARKQRRIINTTRMLLAAHPPWAQLDIRFDVVAVSASGTIEWLQAAFDAEA